MTLRAFEEDEPGDRIREHLAAAWPAFRRWWRDGANTRPTAGEAGARLEEHMPALLPAWQRLAAMLPGDPDAGAALALWSTPPFLTGCSQAAVLGGGSALIRNYDWDMLTVLGETPGQSARAAGEVLNARKQLAEQLVIESSRHEAAEEQYFWPAVRERLGDRDQLADEGIGQESEAKEVLAKIDKLEPSDPEFDRLIAEFIPAARRHIEFKETRVSPGLRQALSGP